MTKIPPGLVQDPDQLLPEEVADDEARDETREKRPELHDPAEPDER